MLFIFRGLPYGDAALSKYIGAWANLLKVSEKDSWSAIRRSLFDHFYENLTILDNKTNSLLQLNGILIAAYAFVVGDLSHRVDAHVRSVFILGATYAAVAVLFCLYILRIHWSSVDELKDAVAHVRKLIFIRNWRTVAYRRAWTFSLISILSLLALVAVMVQWVDIPANWPVDSYLLALVAVHLAAVFAYDYVALDWGEDRAASPGADVMPRPASRRGGATSRLSKERPRARPTAATTRSESPHR